MSLGVSQYLRQRTKTAARGEASGYRRSARCPANNAFGYRSAIGAGAQKELRLMISFDFFFCFNYFFVLFVLFLPNLHLTNSFLEIPRYTALP
jgi:hypothetical protein